MSSQGTLYNCPFPVPFPCPFCKLELEWNKNHKKWEHSFADCCLSGSIFDVEEINSFNTRHDHRKPEGCKWNATCGMMVPATQDSALIYACPCAAWKPKEEEKP